MNVYLGANEIDPQTLGSLGLEGIYKGSDTVWTPAPSIKRLALEIKADGIPSIDGRWEDVNGGGIAYVDMPVDYVAIRLTSIGSSDWDFTPQNGSWNPDSSLKFTAFSSPRQGFVFKGIKYIPYGGTAFDVDLTTTRNQNIPMDETGGFIQDGDKMVMVFEEQTAPSTFTSVATNKGNDILSIVNSSVATMATQGITGGYAYAVLGDNGLYYLYGSSGTWGNYTLYAIEYDPNNDAVTKYKIDTSSKMYTQLNASQSYWATRDYFSTGQTWSLFNYAGVNSIQEFGEEIYDVLIS